MKKLSIFLFIILLLGGIYAVGHWLISMPEESDFVVSEKDKGDEAETKVIAALDEPIQVSGEAEADARIAMKPRKPEEAPEEEKKVVISGTVIEENTGRPITHFKIHFFNEALIKTMLEDKVSVSEEIDDAGGEFAVAMEQGGEYRVSVRADGYYLPEAIEVEVPEDQGLTGLIIKMKKTLCIRGRIVDDETGAPVEGAEVKPGFVTLRQRDADGNVSTGYRLSNRQTASNPQGEFELSDLRPGLYMVSVTHEEYIAQAVEAVAGNEAVEIRLQPGEKSYRIFGEVRNDEGIVAQGIQVKFKAYDGTQGGPYLTDSQGSYSTDPIPAGRVRVWAMANMGSLNFTEEGCRVEIKDHDVQVDFGPSPDHVTWRGTFYGWDGDPVSRGKVRVWNDRIDDIYKKEAIDRGVSIHRTETCDRQGRFEFRKLIPATFKVDMVLPGQMSLNFQAELDQVVFERPGVFEMDLHFRKTEISGVVLDGETHEPVQADFGFVSASATGNKYYSNNIDAKGRFCFRGLPPGEYFLSAHAEGKASVSYGSVTVEDNEIVDNLQITLPVNGHLKVTVKGLSEAEGIIITLRVKRTDNSSAWTVGPGKYTSDPSWEIDFPHEVGSWILELSDATLGKVERPYEIHPKETTELTFNADDFVKE